MEFRLLGPVEVIRAGELLPVGGARDRALLAALLLRANEVAPVGYLVESAWERTPASPDTNLRTYISRLRRRLADSADDAPRVVTRDGGYLFVVNPGELDVAEFERQFDVGRDAQATGDHATAASAYSAALALWRNDPLTDQRHGPTLEAELTRLRGRRLDALEGYAHSRIQLGRAVEVIEDLTTFVDEYPLREELWAQLMTALYRTGRRADALATYVRAQTHLVDEVGVEPGPRLRDLHAAMLRDAPELGPESAEISLAASRPVPPAQLPADLPTFTGRSGELDQLTALLSSDHRPSTVIITAIDGMAGIGKTTLATHVAHRVRDRFPGGQLFLDLHGHTEGVPPVDPGDALDRMLRALGVPGDQIPRDTEERSAFYRTQLADRTMLIVLDNAASERQVAPLLPANPACVVLVTSRRRLSDLEHAVPLSLDVLSPDEAAVLFIKIAGADRVAGAPELVREIVERCGRLPLAIRIAAARLRSRPGWTLGHLADRLGDERRRLDELDHGDRGVAAAFELSYRHLDTEQRRVFRLLGVHPGVDTDAHAVAALVGVPLVTAERALDDLVQAHLLTEQTPGRFVLHDLLRTFAADRAAAEDTDGERASALDRLLDHYVSATALAMELADPAYARHRPVVPDAVSELPSLDAKSANSWLEVELVNLAAAARVVAARPQTSVLARLLGRWLSTRGHNGHALALHLAAVAASRTLDNPIAEAYALVGVGDAHSLADRYPDAGAAYLEALAVSETTGDRQARLLALAGLGDFHRLTDDHGQARERYYQALGLSRELGDELVEQRTLRGLGVGFAVTGDLALANTHFTQALETARATGERGYEARSLASLAMTHRHWGNHDAAFEYAQRALDIVQDLGDLGAEISVRNELGRNHRLVGELTAALWHAQHALDIARSLGDRLGESQVLKAVGEVHLAAERHDQAITCYRAAVAISREIANRNDLFEGLYGLGRALMSADRTSEAVPPLEEALSVATALDQPHDIARAGDALAATATPTGV
ncbi:AfsR/SARP family transcriptional regulator [Tenggerimyces flavus]|uniref:BTAD domain-containing putative transcriptional regulator n=1 Tax=Tenggerimyces flavus TaxID=1708749 RepID=A0ABV7YKZ4_9ACTN|nr:BTAD domain-containing putative transcriptional regulator [Tenggerimyces flavus]MBM7789710.1 DNA-binding SARP family transcriptional activator [Tenggerimyces flavus]